MRFFCHQLTQSSRVRPGTRSNGHLFFVTSTAIAVSFGPVGVSSSRSATFISVVASTASRSKGRTALRRAQNATTSCSWHVNSEKARTAKSVFNIDLGSDDGKYKLELENGVLNHTANAEAKDADATITLNRDALNKIILKETTLNKA